MPALATEFEMDSVESRAYILEGEMDSVEVRVGDLEDVAWQNQKFVLDATDISNGFITLTETAFPYLILGQSKILHKLWE